MTSAREIAYRVLCAHEKSGRFVSQLLDAEFAARSPTTADRKLATELTAGVVRRRKTLDAILSPHVRRPRHQVEPALWTLLRLGCEQLVFLAVPQHAAVHETVELAKQCGSKRWSGFVNGVLRAVSRTLTDDVVNEHSAHAIPIDRDRHRLCSAEVFPEPENDFTGYFAAAFSFPRWLARRWTRRFQQTELIRMGFHFNSVRPPHLRVNSLRADREAVGRMLDAVGVAHSLGELPASIHLEESHSVEQLPGFADGLFSVQDETAMRVGIQLAPQPGETILDLCAGPGTKTTHLAELMQNTGRIIATDVQADRLHLIENSTERLGIGIIETRLFQRDGTDMPDGPFDAILVDVPCSNTGVLGKRPEARWRLQQSDLQELPAIQRRLLTAALDRVSAGGRVLYSTCSIEPEENERVVQAVLKGRVDCELVDSRLTLPGQPSDGGFSAQIQRRT